MVRRWPRTTEPGVESGEIAGVGRRVSYSLIGIRIVALSPAGYIRAASETAW